MLCTYSNPQKKEKQHPMKIVCIHVCEDVALDFPFHSILYHIASSSNDHIMNCEFDTCGWIKLAMKYHIHGGVIHISPSHFDVKTRGFHG